MSHTAHKTDEEKKEFFDSPEELEQKVDELAAQIRSAKHFVVFTGAGISTSAGIPDFRSGVNTVLETGPGCWEKKANIKKAAASKGKNVKQPSKKATSRTAMARAIPTAGHMTLCSLLEAGILKHVISQNVDGLHRKSGIPADKLTEVHGNTNLEICTKCGKGYMRDYRTRTATRVHDHNTGRRCDDAKCRGDLKDTIINFGENLRQCDLDTGFEQGARADLMVSIGSSLRVTPAADMFGETLKNKDGKVWIINLQKTPYTDVGTQTFNLQKTPYTNMATQIYAKIDDVLRMVMQKLQLDIPEFKLKRYARFSLENRHTKATKREYVSVCGVDETGGPYTIFNNVSINGSNSWRVETKLVADEVYKTVFTFQGHYNEPDLTVEVPKSLLQDNACDVMMTYNPNRGAWESVTTKDGTKSLNFQPKKDEEGLSQAGAQAGAEAGAEPGIGLESLSISS